MVHAACFALEGLSEGGRQGEERKILRAPKINNCVVGSGTISRQSGSVFCLEEIPPAPGPCTLRSCLF